MKVTLLIVLGVLLASCARLSTEVHIFDTHNSSCLKDLSQVPKDLYNAVTKGNTSSSLPNYEKFEESFSKPNIQQKLKESLGGLRTQKTFAEEFTDELKTSGSIWKTYIENDTNFGQKVETALPLAGRSLLDDRYASRVLYAPESCWKAEFGTASGHGYFGNSDIAIKMEDAGSFVVKGLRLDASKMTQALFKGLNQGIMVLAGAYGVPSGKSSTGQNQAGEDGSVYEDVANAEKQKLDSTLSIRLSRDRTLRLFEEIVAQQAALAMDSEGVWRPALANIKHSIASYKNLLEPAE